jgi:hypothetical protein
MMVDGDLPSPLSYALINDDPPLPSTPTTQHSRQILKERCRFQNAGWTQWQVVQFMNELDAKREMEKAD